MNPDDILYSPIGDKEELEDHDFLAPTITGHWRNNMGFLGNCVKCGTSLHDVIFYDVPCKKK
jgi:hypothetical protein